MCLEATVRATRSLRSKMVCNGRLCKFYKVYRLENSRGKIVLKSPYRRSLAEAGIIVSGRDSKTWNNYSDINYGYYSKINKGIHVFLTREDAKWDRDTDADVVVPIYCHVNDLVAAGKFGQSKSSAVFMKISLHKRDYERAIAKAKKMGWL